MQRREFLESLAALILVSLGGCSTKGPVRVLQKKKKIIVIGAGLAGLAAAHELQLAGHEVIIFEGNDRVGGRVLTSRNHGPDQQYIEWGATRIADTHHHTLHYIEKFNLELDDIPSGNQAYYFKGQRHLSPHELPANWLLKLKEKNLGLSGIKALPYQTLKELGDPNAKDWLMSEEVRKLDSMTYTDYLKTLGLSSTALALNRYDSGSDGDHYSAALWLAQSVLDQNWGKTFKVKGGNDLLPKALAKDLKIKLNSSVTKIVREAQQVKVYSGEEYLVADEVVLTVSPAILKKIQFLPELAAKKRAAIEQVKMGSVVKTSFIMKERFWQEEKLGGLCVGYSDTQAERVYDLTVTQPGTCGILMSYTQFKFADELSAMNESSRVKFMSEKISKIFPKASKNILEGISFDWKKQEWIQGAWVSFSKNQILEYLALKEKEEMLYFAGDHTSYHCGWMQGALESGRRVANEIDA